MDFSGANLISKIFLFYCRKIFNHPAKLRIVRSLHWLLKNQIKVISPNNATLQLVPKDYISWQIIFAKSYEPISLLLSIEILKSTKGAFVDVGANFGLYTSVLTKECTDRIIAIEPQTDNFIKLKKNISLNADNNKITALNVAVGADCKLVEMESPVSNNNGTFRVVVNPVDSITKDFYPMLDLNTILNDLNITEIALMKIDIEGYEMEALKGIDWNSGYKPQNILIEYSDYVSRTGSSSKEVMNYLLQKGYYPYLIDKTPYSDNTDLPEDNLLFTLK